MPEADALIGRRFRVRQTSLFFPMNFTVIDESSGCVRLKNDVETYWITRPRFDAARGRLDFYDEAGKRPDDPSDRPARRRSR